MHINCFNGSYKHFWWESLQEWLKDFSLSLQGVFSPSALTKHESPGLSSAFPIWSRDPLPHTSARPSSLFLGHPKRMGELGKVTCFLFRQRIKHIKYKRIIIIKDKRIIFTMPSFQSCDTYPGALLNAWQKRTVNSVGRNISSPKYNTGI